jgi:hypothetical protein
MDIENEQVLDPSGQKQKGAKSMEYLIFLGIIVVWIILQVWVFPRLGIKT